jgi:hypothetical protein
VLLGFDKMNPHDRDPKDTIYHFKTIGQRGSGKMVALKFDELVSGNIVYNGSYLMIF